jgi:hypothetical protein
MMRRRQNRRAQTKGKSMKRYNSISDVKRDYEDKQKEKPEIMPVPHSQRYHEKVKAAKTPPPSSKQTYGQNEYD